MMLGDYKPLKRIGSDSLHVEVRAVVQEAPEVFSYELADAHGEPLPEFTPGAHIDVYIPESDDVRQYSLWSDSAERELYRIAVTRHEQGRGSRYLHEHVKAGSVLTIGRPRNDFVFEPASRYLFIAGGIGITPLLSMALAAERAGVPWELHYCTRDLDEAPFVPLLTRFGDRVKFYGGMQGTRLSVVDLFASGAETADSLVYCCGPKRLMTAVDKASTAHYQGRVRFESFLPAPVEAGTPFELECARSGKVLTIPSQKSILQVFDESGIRVRRSCRKGICRTCEVRVLKGEPDHRDSVLTESERAEGKKMMVCVSRAKSARLVLDV